MMFREVVFEGDWLAYLVVFLLSVHRRQVNLPACEREGRERDITSQ